MGSCGWKETLRQPGGWGGQAGRPGGRAHLRLESQAGFRPSRTHEYKAYLIHFRDGVSSAERVHPGDQAVDEAGDQAMARRVSDGYEPAGSLLPSDFSPLFPPPCLPLPPFSLFSFLAGSHYAIQAGLQPVIPLLLPGFSSTEITGLYCHACILISNFYHFQFLLDAIYVSCHLGVRWRGKQSSCPKGKVPVHKLCLRHTHAYGWLPPSGC